MDIQDNHCDEVSNEIALTILDELLSYLDTFKNKPFRANKRSLPEIIAVL